MKTYYQITAEEIGIVLLRKRKIAKALRRWLRENGLSYEYNFYIQWSFRNRFFWHYPE